MRDRVVAFDIEMPSQKSMRLSAIGITVIDHGEITDKYFYLINPETEFDPYVVKLIGITKDMVKNEPTFPVIWEKIKDVMSSGLLVAHGATGDLMALCSCLKDYNIKWKDKIEYTCTCDMGIKCYKDLGAYSLDALCNHIGFNSLNHHNALSDSEGCAQLFLDYMKNGIDVNDFLYNFDAKKCIKIRPKTVKKKKSFEQRVQNILLSSSVKGIKNNFLKRNPNYLEEKVIGVKEGTLRQISIKLIKNGKASAFLSNLPHKYHEEDNIHAMLISGNKKISSALLLTQKFLPYIDNTETLSLLSPYVFKLHPDKIFESICLWLTSENIYICIFAINSIINCYRSFEELFIWFDNVSSIESNNSLVCKKKAEFFAHALLLNEEETALYFESIGIDKWTRNMAIQIAAFSKGVDENQRERLVALRK